jgi:transposase
MSKDTNAPWENESLLREKYCEEGLTIQEIADEWDTTFETVRYYKDRYDIQGRPNGVSPSVSKLTKDKLQELYHGKEKSLAEIADDFDVSETTVLARMREFDIERRVADDEKSGPWENEYRLCKLYHGEDMTLKQVANELGCSETTVINWMDRFGIDRELTPDEKPPNFRTNYHGYEEVRTKIDGKQYTVSIHRLVAVAKGILSPSELLRSEKHVHHKNSIPWDNREENLATLSKSEHHSLHYKERDIDDKGKLL